MKHISCSSHHRANLFRQPFGIRVQIIAQLVRGDLAIHCDDNGDYILAGRRWPLQTFEPLPNMSLSDRPFAPWHADIQLARQGNLATGQEYCFCEIRVRHAHRI